MDLNNLKDLYIEQLKDMYSAEKQLTEVLPDMAKAANSPELKKAFQSHLTQTEGHMETVNTLLSELDANPGNKKCVAMEGLVEEGRHVVNQKGDPDVRDAGLILAAQKVEHYEIATYGGLCTYAKSLGFAQAAETLQGILDVEYETDKKLDNLAMGLHGETSVNQAAMR